MEKPTCHHCKTELSQIFIQEVIDDLEPEWKEAHFKIHRNCPQCEKILEFEVTSGMYFLITPNGSVNLGAR